ncbi:MULTISPECIES: arylsulfotransferase family protein [unclassified Meridianimarinicoccus]|uniref:arylsulfotransferase family protein n=1 Tax=unclassified Meridianimarinicoccus TaxID=2923344 RepID=UPI001866C16D|nr:arylsulfotransferase family protein [Fluviibacterium sp. MJW13]
MSKILPILMPVVSLVLLVFGAGVFVGEYQVPPYRTIADGAKTILYTYRGISAPPYLGQFHAHSRERVALEDAVSSRFTPGPRATEPQGGLLINGGLNEYLELCPEHGCLAVEIDRSGAVVHATPFRPDEIFAADMTDGSFGHQGVPGDPALIFRPLGLQRYDNGDLLISFQSTGNMFPFAAGAARVDRDGHPVWFRFDFSHHWATLLPDGRALVPDLDIATGDWVVPVGPRGSREKLKCDTGRPQVDGVQILRADGSVERRIDVSAALLASPWSAMLAETTNACDPLHINYVDVLDYTAPGGALQPGNLVISLRNLSAVAVLDPATDTITDVVRGSFVQQHSVHHLTGSKMVMFDNWGGDAEVGRVSRLLEVDLVTGQERRIFPQPGTPQAAEQLFSDRGSHLSLSPDRRRALVSYSGEGRGYEVDVATGEVYLQYDSLHDLSAVPGANAAQKSHAARASLFGMLYTGE